MVTRKVAEQPRQLAKNTAFLFSSQMVHRLSTLVLTFVIARSLGAEGLGVYATAMAVYASAQRAGFAGTGAYIVREIGKTPERAAHLIVHVSFISVIVTGLLTGALLLAVPLLGYSSELELSVSIVVLAIMPRILNALQSNAFVAWGDTRFQPVVTFIGAVVMVSMSLGLLAWGAPIAAVLIVFVAIEYAKVLIWFFLINRYITRLRWRIQPRVALSMFWEMRTFTASSGLNALFSGPEIVMLSIIASEREVGYYSATLKLVELWGVMPGVFLGNIYPLLSRSFYRNDGRFGRLQTMSLRLVLAFSLPIAVGLLVVAGPIIGTVYGDGFDPAVDQLRVMAVYVVLFALTETFWRVLSARNRHGGVVRSQLLSIPVRLGLGYVLMTQFGAMGAAIATVVGMATHLAILVVSARRSGAPVGLLSAARLLAAAAGMGAAVWVLTPFAPLPVLVVVGAVAYVALVVVLKALPDGDRAKIRQIWARGTGSTNAVDGAGPPPQAT